MSCVYYKGQIYASVSTYCMSRAEFDALPVEDRESGKIYHIMDGGYDVRALGYDGLIEQKRSNCSHCGALNQVGVCSYCGAVL